MRQFFDVFEKPNIAYAFLSQTRSNQSESFTRTDLCNIQSESSLNLITPSVHIMQNGSYEIIFVCIIQIDYFPTENFFFSNFLHKFCWPHMYRLRLHKNSFYFLIYVQIMSIFEIVNFLTVGHWGSFLKRQKIDGWGIRVKIVKLLFFI